MLYCIIQRVMLQNLYDLNDFYNLYSICALCAWGIGAGILAKRFTPCTLHTLHTMQPAPILASRTEASLAREMVG